MAKLKWNREKHIDPTIEKRSFVASEGTLIGIGPATLDQAVTESKKIGGDIPIVPIGLIENAKIRWNQSTRPYAGGYVEFQSVLWDGKNLLRRVYEAFKKSKLKDLNPSFCLDSDFFFNMAEPLLEEGFGIFIWMKNEKNETYASLYLEKCKVSDYLVSLSSTAIINEDTVFATFLNSVVLTPRLLKEIAEEQENEK